jgi:hypothetical protein
LDRVEFLFAHWAVPRLKDLRGARWKALVTRIAPLPPTDSDALAFALMMVKLNGCAQCDAKLYRERRGCANCARFVLRNLNKEDEASLLLKFHGAQQEISRSLQLNAVD